MSSDPSRSTRLPRDRVDRLLVAVVIGSVAIGVVGRFVTRSPLWLDEALSVNIASLPLGDLTDALRQDGHPPLYYVLLHGWMELAGTGDAAVRAFSGLWGLALLPLMWVAGRRLGGRRVACYAVVLLAVSPYAWRYGTETRMYAMVSVLALAGWLLVGDALRRPHPLRLVGVAVLTSALLWTHYWSMWLLAAAVIGLVVHGTRARREGDGVEVARTVRVGAAMVVGGLTFLPWLPHLLYQGSHTGTPWARPMRPTEMVVNSVVAFGGTATDAEAVVLGWSLVIAVLVGVFAVAWDRRTVTLDLRTNERSRPLAILVGATLTIGCLAGYASGSTYAARYAAVFFPFVILLAALGLSRLASRGIALAVLGALVVLSGVGDARNVLIDRSDAERSAAAIEARARPGDWVVYCPDQLGPSTSRVLEGEGLQQVTYPEFSPPERVDWVDYAERLDRVEPSAFADDLLRRSDGAQIFLVYSANYETHRTICPELRDLLSSQRVPEELSQAGGAYEPSSVVVFPPASRP